MRERLRWAYRQAWRLGIALLGNPDEWAGNVPGDRVKVTHLEDAFGDAKRVGQSGKVGPWLDEGLLRVRFEDGAVAGFWPEEVRRVG